MKTPGGSIIQSRGQGFNKVCSDMETSCINHRLRSHLFIFVLRINKIVYTNARQFRDEIIGLTMEIWMVLVLQQ
ncbi:unnamed protein product [Rhizophagus irregularis]|nr:unnamed protein product [Rhizophagus irregularis]